VPADLPLTAVIHAAGVADPVLLADTGPGRMAEVLAAKVIGATLVEALLDRHPAATAVHFSSVSAAWGVRSHGPYAAANAYLDAHAQRLTGQGRSVSAIAWGPWAGGGMAADTFGETVRGNGVPELAPDSALAVLDDVLGAAPANVVVTELDWELFAPRFTVNRASALFDDIPAARAALATTDPGAAASTADALRHSLAGLRPQEQKRTILDLVRRAAATVLGHDAPGRIEPRRSFTDIGFDSLTAVEFRNKLMSVTGLTLATTVVFDHPTVYDLAAALHTRLVPLDQQAGAADPADDDIRQRLATVPLTALREAGLLDALLALSGTGHESSQMSSGDSGAIDEMDLDGLLRMALNNGS
jgi:acyl carrier protein